MQRNEGYRRHWREEVHDALRGVDSWQGPSPEPIQTPELRAKNPTGEDWRMKFWKRVRKPLAIMATGAAITLIIAEPNKIDPRCVLSSPLPGVERLEQEGDWSRAMEVSQDALSDPLTCSGDASTLRQKIVADGLRELLGVTVPPTDIFSQETLVSRYRMLRDTARSNRIPQDELPSSWELAQLSALTGKPILAVAVLDDIVKRGQIKLDEHLQDTTSENHYKLIASTWLTAGELYSESPDPVHRAKGQALLVDALEMSILHGLPESKAEIEELLHTRFNVTSSSQLRNPLWKYAVQRDRV